MSEEFIARLAQMASRASWAKCSFDAMERPHYVNDLPHLHAADGRVTHESYEWVAATDPETIARLCAALERAERVVEAARAVREAEGELEVTALFALYAALRDYDASVTPATTVPVVGSNRRDTERLQHPGVTERSHERADTVRE